MSDLVEAVESGRRYDVEHARVIGDGYAGGVEELQGYRLGFMRAQDAVAADGHAHIRAAERRENGGGAVAIEQRGVGAQVIQHEEQGRRRGGLAGVTDIHQLPFFSTLGRMRSF